jgi:spore germination protein (amino acid permease)
MKALEKIDQGQLLLLLLFTISSTIQLPLPRFLALAAGRAGWISALVGSVFGLAILAVPTLLALRLPPGPLPVALESLLGKLRVFGAAFIVGMMPRTPASALILIFMLNVFLLSYLGLEPIARSAQAFAIPIVLAFLVVVFGSIPPLDLLRLKPWFADGLLQILRGATFVAPYFGEGAIVLYLIPALQNKEGIWKTISWSGVLVCLAFASLTFASIGTLTATWTASVPYPGLRLARNVSIGRFFHRFEPLFLSMWYLSVYLKTSLLLFLAAQLLAHVFNQKNYRLLLGILLAVAFPLAFLPKDLLEVFALQFGFARLMSFVIGFVLPGVLLFFTFRGGKTQ